MTEEAVLNLAREVASAEGWRWQEPVHVRRHRRWFGSARWQVLTSSEMRGMNVRIVIDDATGRVLEKSFLPR